jgi:hypothetical protein
MIKADISRCHRIEIDCIWHKESLHGFILLEDFTNVALVEVQTLDSYSCIMSFEGSIGPSHV